MRDSLDGDMERMEEEPLTRRVRVTFESRKKLVREFV